MSKQLTTWAGDHPEEAEAQLAKAHIEIAPLLRCINEDIHEFESGVCLICEAEDEDYEPTDAQIPGTYEIGKAVAA
jgi:hypothetical protein